MGRFGLEGDVFVFTSKIGTPLDESSGRLLEFPRLVKPQNFQRFHDLRQPHFLARSSRRRP